MRVIVIGATGHVGSYRFHPLVSAGHQVIFISRGKGQPYHHDPDVGVRRTCSTRR